MEVAGFPTGVKDVDILFLSRLEDDRDLLNALNTNRATKKYADDENLWRNRFKRQHPEDFEYVQNLLNVNKRSWKDFSLLLLQYIDLEGHYDFALRRAARDGNEDLVDYFIYKGTINWNLGMQGAAEGGHPDLVDFFIRKGADDWNWGMFKAAYGGHRDLVDFFIKKGANNWDSAMYYSALGGHKDLIEFFISQGADNWVAASQAAQAGGYRDLVRFFRNKARGR